MSASSANPASGEFPTTRSAECPFDPAVGYTEYREKDPIARVSCPVGVDAWLVTRYHDARTVLADPRLSSRRAPSMHVDPMRTSTRSRPVLDRSCRPTVRNTATSVGCSSANSR